MRAVDCPCGEHLEGNNDEDLLKQAKSHNEQDHPDQYQESDLRLLINTGAYDTGG